jgi:hypothetical protein
MKKSPGVKVFAARSLAQVVKSDGRRQEFDPEKVRATLRHYGVTGDQAEEIIREIRGSLRDGVSTAKMLQMINQHLEWREVSTWVRHDLRTALGRMIPAPDFEEYVRILLRAEGYHVEPNKIIRGHCVTHEIDGVAFKDGKLFYLETKHHSSTHTLTDFSVSLAAKAKLDDITRGYHEGLNQYLFDKVLIVCNTRLTEHARRYADCMGIDHLGWKTPDNRGLEAIITEKCIYPVTILKSLKVRERNRLSDAGVVTLNQLMETDVAKLGSGRLMELRKETEVVLK